MNAERGKPRIVCMQVPAHIERFRQILESFAKVEYADWNASELLKHIKDYDGIVTQINTLINEDVIEEAENLKVIATPSTGTDHIDISAAEKKGIAVLSIKDDIEFLNRIPSTAELAFGLMLSVLRYIPQSFESVKLGEWDGSSFRGHMLMGRTLGIIGAGRLGKMMCKYGNAFGMRVLVYDPYTKVDLEYVTQVDLKYLLSNSDVVTVHVHLNEETKGLIGKRELGFMKPDAVLINTSRGAVIDEYALVEALENKRIGGAGLDVLADELTGGIRASPVVEYARSNRNVVITPHIGGRTYEAQELAYARTAEKLLEWFKGG